MWEVYLTDEVYRWFDELGDWQSGQSPAGGLRDRGSGRGWPELGPAVGGSDQGVVDPQLEGAAAGVRARGGAVDLARVRCCWSRGQVRAVE